MIRVRAVPARNIKNAAENNEAKLQCEQNTVKDKRNLIVDKMRFSAIMIRNEKALKRRVSWERNCRERGHQAASLLFRNLLKTTSERLKNSPVTPL